MTQVNVFDSGVCSLGEGALWHPTRNQFFWFDINNNALFSREDGTRIRWDFDAHVTAAGWVNDDQLMMPMKPACCCSIRILGKRKDRRFRSG